jgi:diacylglycerol kinase (ATP)
VRLQTQSGGRLRRRAAIIERVIVPTNIVDWTPVLVFANPKSGNGEGEIVLKQFRRTLNPIQVIDLSRMSPDIGLRWCRLMADSQVAAKVRVIVAGGDGSVSWILSAIERLQLSPPPTVAVLPLGTGNDLSRVLGWGAGHSGGVDAVDWLERYARAVPVQIDRWAVRVTPRRRFGE